MSRIHDVTDRPSRIVVNTKLSIQVELLAELKTVLICKQLVAAVILGRDLCYQFVAFIFLATLSVRLADGSTVAVFRRFGNRDQ